jgi:hypothetical protein
VNEVTVAQVPLASLTQIVVTPIGAEYVVGEAMAFVAAFASACDA